MLMLLPTRFSTSTFGSVVLDVPGQSNGMLKKPGATAGDGVYLTTWPLNTPLGRLIATAFVYRWPAPWTKPPESTPSRRSALRLVTLAPELTAKGALPGFTVSLSAVEPDALLLFVSASGAPAAVLLSVIVNKFPAIVPDAPVAASTVFASVFRLNGVP